MARHTMSIILSISLHFEPNDDDGSSLSESEIPLTIPDNASVDHAVVDGTPGLSITMRTTRNWTPIASSIRAQTKNSSIKS